MGLPAQLVTFNIHTAFLQSTWEYADEVQQRAEY